MNRLDRATVSRRVGSTAPAVLRYIIHPATLSPAVMLSNYDQVSTPSQLLLWRGRSKSAFLAGRRTAHDRELDLAGVESAAGCIKRSGTKWMAPMSGAEPAEA